MSSYNAHDMARSFRTVRANTIKIAEEIPEEKYSFRPAEGCRSVAETLAHISVTSRFPKRFQSTRPTTINFALFTAEMPRMMADEAALQTKAQILDALRADGEDFASWLDTLSDEFLNEEVHFPEGMQPPSKTRFEMLSSTKEHEMHHRAQLMLVERMIGIVPHLTRDFQARLAQMQQQQSTAGASA